MTAMTQVSVPRCIGGKCCQAYISLVCEVCQEKFYVIFHILSLWWVWYKSMLCGGWWVGVCGG